MAKNKIIKDKSPIKLRQKKLRNGNWSLYLDIYDSGERSKEYLKLYLIPEKDNLSKEQNRKTLKVAETIKAERILNLQAKKSKFFNEDNEYSKISFADYMEKEIEKMRGIKSKNHIRRYTTSLNWIRRFDNKTKLKDLNRLWVQKYLHFLKITQGRYKKKLNQNTIHEYLIYLANILNTAVREGIIARNPTKDLSTADRPKKYESKKIFLTQEEIKRLRDVPSPCKYSDLRGAFLFSCYCGLRYSDIQQLEWKDIRTQDNSVSIEKKIQKTQNMLILPLNKTAVELLPERGEDNERVFKLPKSMATVETYIKIWSEFAKIDKHITFHTARHTFATSILSCGGDVYTLSKLLGHKKVTTTQIYAEVLEQTKLKTVKLLDSFVQKDCTE